VTRGDIAYRAPPGPLLSQEQSERYSRQINLDEIGPRGQARLLRSKVAIVGAGGLGSPTAIYLAAAGVGTIGLIDADRVDRSNLHRQPLHFDHRVGRLKVRSGSCHLKSLNPDINVEEHPVRLSSENALEILCGYDVIVNGSDNFPTRYLVNDACVMLGKPLVDASILRWEGRLSVFMPGQGCYRCLFPNPPAPGTIPSCAEGGVVGAVAGVLGTMQALETIKVLLGVDGVLSDRTLVMDALAGCFRIIRWHRRLNCPACGEVRAIRKLIDYELFCGVPGSATAAGHSPIPNMTLRGGPVATSKVDAASAVQWLGDPDVLWIDVRESWEFKKGRVPGSRLIPLHDLSVKMDQIPRHRTIVSVCRTGHRSGVAVEILRGAGRDKAFSMDGGLLGWENHGYPLEHENASESAS